MPKRINPGDVNQGVLYAWNDECAKLEVGLDTYQFAGWAKIDSTLRNEIDIVIPSLQKRKADKQFIVPANAFIYRIGLRLPNKGNEGQPASVYGLLSGDQTIVGTTGERLKVASTATNHAATSPVIVAANNAYVADASAVVAVTEWETPAAPLVKTSAPTQFKIYVSNAGNTAAGNGIRTSSGEAYILVEVCFKTVAEALHFERVGGYPYQPDQLQTV